MIHSVLLLCLTSSFVIISSSCVSVGVSYQKHLDAGSTQSTLVYSLPRFATASSSSHFVVVTPSAHFIVTTMSARFAVVSSTRLVIRFAVAQSTRLVVCFAVILLAIPFASPSFSSLTHHCISPDLHVSRVMGSTLPVWRLCQNTPLSRLSPSPDRVTNSNHHLTQTLASFLTGLYAIDYAPDKEAASTHQGFYGAKLHQLDLSLLVTAGSIVQECCFARFPHEVFIVASLTHYAVSSIDGSSQSRVCGFPDILVAGTIVQECGLARFTNSITAAFPSHYAVSSIDGSSHSQLSDLDTGVVPQRSIHPKAFYLLSDICSHTLLLNECDDCLLRSLVTTCWARHGNVEFRILDQAKPSAMSSNLISRSASPEVKLELKIHLVSSVRFVGSKADRSCLSAKSSQIGLCSLNVVNRSRVSHLEFLPVNISVSSYRCFNVVFDYPLFSRTIAMGTKVKLLFGFLHFAERASPLYGFISSCYVWFFSFILPSNLTPGFSASVVNIAL